MSGNVNCANYCNFENNRSTNVRVNQTPGGNSTLSLAWTSNDTPAMRPPTAVRGQYHGRYPSSHGVQRENDENKGLRIGGDYNYFKDNGTTDKVGEKKGVNSGSSSGVRENSNYYNQNNYNHNNYANNGSSDCYEGTYSRPVSQQYNLPSKQSYQDVYQQKYLNNKNDYQPAVGRQANNNNNNDRQVYNRDAYAPRQQQADKQRSISSNQSYQQQQQYAQTTNQPRQNNTIHDIKFGYRVTQPPGGKSSIVFG